MNSQASSDILELSLPLHTHTALSSPWLAPVDGQARVMDGNVTLNEPQQYSYGLTIYVGGPIERSWCPFMRYSPVESVFEEEITVRASAFKRATSKLLL